MKITRFAGLLPAFLLAVFTLTLSLSLRAQTPQAPLIEVERPEVGRVELSWPSSLAEFELEVSSSLSPSGSWQSFFGSTSVQGDRVVASVNLDGPTRYFRLRYSDSAPLTILSTSPSHEETGVAVTRKTVFRLNRPLAPDTVLSSDQIFAESGGDTLNIRPQLSKDRRTVTLFYPDGLPSSSRVRVGFSGIDLFDDRGRPIDPDGDGILGGTARIHFDTLTVASLENTGVTGYVYASEVVNGSGNEPMNQPLQGVTITVDGMEETLRATTDENGFFQLQPCPPGRFFVHIDGRTAVGSDWPDGAYYPFVGKSWESVPGQTDTLVGGTGNVYLPYIVPDTLQATSMDDVTMVEFPESVVNERPELDGVSIEVPPDNLFDNDGVRGGRIGIAPVDPDRLPGELPTGLDFPMVITVQTDGAQNFDQPVPARFPNLPDPQTGEILPPGAKTALWSFNHDTGRWEIQGSMTVTPDGMYVVSDPGVGIRQPGWHGVNPGGPGGGPGPGPCAFPPCDDDDPENPNGNDDEEEDCEKVVPCTVPVDPPNPAICALDCIGDVIDEIFGDEDDDRERSPFEPGFCVGNILICDKQSNNLRRTLERNKWEDATTHNERDCMDECMEPNVIVPVVVPCDEVDPCGGVEPQALQSRVSPSSALPDPGDIPRDWLLEQFALWDAQSAYLELVYGTEKIVQTHPGETGLIWAMLEGFAERSEPGSPAGERLSSQERAELEGMTVPSQFTQVEWEDLIDRMDRMMGEELAAQEFPVADVLAAQEYLVSLIEELQARGWEYRLDGLLYGLVVGSFHAAPEVGTEEFPRRSHYYMLRNHERRFTQRGRLNSQGRFEGVILSPNSFYSVTYLDPVSFNIGVAFFYSTENGATTTIPTAVLSAPTDMDSDGDQLTDATEEVLGTDPMQADSDEDGVGDGIELLQGTNPNDGVPINPGVIAIAGIQGNAVQVAGRGDRAALAAESDGVALYDVEDPFEPRLVEQFDPESTIRHVEFAAEYLVTAESLGVGVYDALDDVNPELLTRTAIGGPVPFLTVAGRYIYAPGTDFITTTLAVLHLDSGQLVRHVELGSTQDVTVQAIKHAGDALWVLTSNKLIAFQIQGDDLSPLGELELPGMILGARESHLKLFVGDGVAYVGDRFGFRVLDISDPGQIEILGEPGEIQSIFHDLAYNGAGLMLAITSTGGIGSEQISLFDVTDPSVVDNFLSAIDTPGIPEHMILHRGFALTAEGQAGLAVHHYLPVDTGDSPPSITLQGHFSDPPFQQEAGSLFYVSSITTDDVQVRDVEFYIDDQLVLTSGAFPFGETLRAPGRTPEKTSFDLRAKATDTAGNIAWSDSITVELLPDTTPPTIRRVMPVDQEEVRRGSLSWIEVRFDSAMNPSSLNGAITLKHGGPDDTVDTADDMVLDGGSLVYEPQRRLARLQFNAPLKSGRYQATVAASAADTSNNPIGQDYQWEFLIPRPEVVSTTPFNGAVFLENGLTGLSAIFDERMNGSSIQPGTFQVLSAGGDGMLGTPDDESVAGGSTSWNPFAQEATLSFPNALPNGIYQARIPQSVTDVYGGTLAGDVTWDMTVKGPTLWISDMDGAWESGEHWSIGTRPLVNDHVLIDRAQEDVVVSLNSAATVTTLNAAEDFVLNANTLRVLEEAVFDGLFTWNGQIGLEGNGTIRANGGILVTGPGNNKFLRGQTLINAGLFDWHVGGILLRDAARLHNEAGGVFLMNKTNDSSGIAGSETAPFSVFENDGQIIKAGDEGLMFFRSIELINRGRFDVQNGTFRFTFTMHNSGVLSAEEGTLMQFGDRFEGNDYNQSADGRIEGAGDLVVEGGSATIEGDFALDGTTRVNRGALHFIGPKTIDGGGLVLTSQGTLGFDGPTTVGAGGLQVITAGSTQGGTLVNHQSLAVTETLLWEAGEMTGTGVVRSEGTLHIAGSGQKSLSTRFENAGEATWTNTGVIFMSEEGSLRNLPGGTFEILNDVRVGSSIFWGAFVNEGLLRKRNSTGITPISCAFTNMGIIEAESGTLRFDVAYHQTAGELQLAGGNVELRGQFGFGNNAVAAPFNVLGGEVTGIGEIRYESPNTLTTVLNSGVFRPGAPVGTIAIQGNYEQTAAGTLQIDIGGLVAGSEHDQLSVSRQLQLGGVLEIELVDGFVPEVGQEFVILTCMEGLDEFDSVSGLDLGNGLQFEVVYEPGQVKLVCVQ